MLLANTMPTSVLVATFAWGVSNVRTTDSVQSSADTMKSLLMSFWEMSSGTVQLQFQPVGGDHVWKTAEVAPTGHLPPGIFFATDRTRELHVLRGMWDRLLALVLHCMNIGSSENERACYLLESMLSTVLFPVDMLRTTLGVRGSHPLSTNPTWWTRCALVYESPAPSSFSKLLQMSRVGPALMRWENAPLSADMFGAALISLAQLSSVLESCLNQE